MSNEALSLNTNHNSDLEQLLTNNISSNYDSKISRVNIDVGEHVNLIRKLREICGLDSKKRIIYREELEDLLDSNGFYFRLSTINRDRANYEQIPIIAIFKEHNSTAVIYSKGKTSIAYLPLDDSYDSVKRLSQNLVGSVYEIYPVFPEDLNTFWKLIKFSFPAIRADIIKALLLSILVTLLSLLSPIITSRVVGDVVPSGNMAWILSTFIISVLIALYSSLITWLQSYYLLRFAQKLNLRIQIPLYHRILSYPVPFLDKYNVGDLSSRATSVNSILSSLSSNVLSSLISVVSLFGFVGLMCYYDIYLTIPALVLIFLVALIQTILFRRQLYYERQLIERQADFYEETLQSLANIAQIRTSGGEKSTIERWARIIFSTSSLSFNSSVFSGYNQVISKFLSNFGLSLIYGVLIYRLLNAKDMSEVVLSTSTFIVFQSAFSNFSSKFIQLVQLFNTVFGKIIVDFKRAIPLIHQYPEQGLSIDKTRLALKGLIEFKNVTFAYPNSDRVVLDNISFTIKPGQMNVIFGPSGCGKSTIFSIIVGFYPIQSGSIFVDGQELGDLDIKNLRSQMGTVLQTATLPVSSIKDALTSGLPYPEEDLWSVLKLVNLYDEIQALPMKLETLLSEGASNISGGQRQRVSIARALLRQPAVLLEDESTSALDNYSQKIIVDNLKRIELTRVVIAHRLTAIKDCDHMIVINDGKVEASGSLNYCIENSPYLSSILHKNSHA